MFKSKPSLPPEGNESKIMTDRNKGQASNTKDYRAKKTWNKLIPDPKSKTDFQGRCADLEGYIFDLGQRASINAPEHWRNWRYTLEQNTVTASSQTS